MKKVITALLTAVVAAGLLLAPAEIAGAGKKKKPSGPLVVGVDPTDDWGADPTIAPAGTLLGMELAEASMEMADAKTVNFVIKLAGLPPSGGVPEFARYTWSFSVNDKDLELDGKFTNYTRGVCDPTSGQCPPPRDPGLQPFLLRGTCAPHETVANLIVCEELGVIQATFDAAAGTITIPVPLAMMKAKSGTKIEPGVSSTFGAAVVAIPSAFVSSGNAPHDLMVTTKTFIVP